jgi:hydroxymethylpyrimidine kinase/phosphomethylpyrimidine kinase
MKALISRPVALTVAGSDSGGGAGIQADLNTFRAFDVFGTCAVTCITAQNPDRITAAQPARPEIVADQMECVFSAFRVGGAKTGMLYDAQIVETVAWVFRKHAFRSLVVDPVMVATSGSRLLKKEALAVLKAKLLPQAAVVTPNLAETEILLKHRILTLPELRESARALADHLGVPVLVKGGHRPQSRLVVDVLFDGNSLYEFSAPMVRGIKTHGTGCALSAAIAANLALGHDLVESIVRAKKFVTNAIRHAITIGNHHVLSL